jgi:hypothetical protein
MVNASELSCTLHSLSVSITHKLRSSLHILASNLLFFLPTSYCCLQERLNVLLAVEHPARLNLAIALTKKALHTVKSAPAGGKGLQQVRCPCVATLCVHEQGFAGTASLCLIA